MLEDIEFLLFRDFFEVVLNLFTQKLTKEGPTLAANMGELTWGTCLCVDPGAMPSGAYVQLNYGGISFLIRCPMADST